MASSTETDQKGSRMRSWFFGSCWAIIASTLFCVIMRLVSRRMKAQKLGWDDRSIIFSTAWFLIIVAIGVALYIDGVGYHIYQLRPGQDITIAKLVLVAEMLYTLNLVWTKLSILLMYHRIFEHVRYFRPVAVVLGTLVVAWGIISVSLSGFFCVPFEKNWNPLVQGRCMNVYAVWTANAVNTILTDVAILVLPMPKVWKLHLRAPQRVAILLTFALGFFVVFVSAYRFVVLFSYDPNDSSYTYAQVAIWSLLEIGAGIISANLPLMGPVTGLLLEKAGLRGGLGFISGARSAHKNSHYMFGASGIRMKTTGMSTPGGVNVFKTGMSTVTMTSKAEDEALDVVTSGGSSSDRTKQLEEYELLALAAPPEKTPHGRMEALAVPGVVCLSTAEKKRTGLVEEVLPGEIRVTREFGHSTTRASGRL